MFYINRIGAFLCFADDLVSSLGGKKGGPDSRVPDAGSFTVLEDYDVKLMYTDIGSSVQVSGFSCLCVCACVCEIERERREKERAAAGGKDRTRERGRDLNSRRASEQDWAATESQETSFGAHPHRNNITIRSAVLVTPHRNLLVFSSLLYCFILFQGNNKFYIIQVLEKSGSYYSYNR